MFDSFKKLWRWDIIPKSFWYLLFKKVVLLLTYYNDIDFLTFITRVSHIT